MIARRMNPFAALHEMQREMNRLFDGYGLRSNAGSWTRPTTFPALNVWEDGDSLYAEAEIPGVSQDDIEVYAVGNELPIKGTRKPREGEDNHPAHRCGRGKGSGELERRRTDRNATEGRRGQAQEDNG